jgi:hypothetical protein
MYRWFVVSDKKPYKCGACGQVSIVLLVKYYYLCVSFLGFSGVCPEEDPRRGICLLNVKVGLKSISPPPKHVATSGFKGPRDSSR